MKSSAVEITFKIWAIGLGIIAFGGILISIFNVIVGNYVGTASFEFQQTQFTDTPTEAQDTRLFLWTKPFGKSQQAMAKPWSTFLGHSTMHFPLFLVCVVWEILATHGVYRGQRSHSLLGIFFQVQVFLENMAPPGCGGGVKKGGPAYRVKTPSRIGVAIGAGIARARGPIHQGRDQSTPFRGPSQGSF